MTFSHTTIDHPQQLSAETVVKTLLEVEQQSRRQRVHYSFQDLLGNWRLSFITGTKKSRQKAGVLLGAGKYLSSWVKISIDYHSDNPESLQGKVENTVELGLFLLQVSGLIKYLPAKNILVFDFTRLLFKIGNFSLYNGFVGNGETRENKFFSESIKNQAFFTYFYVDSQTICARGKGGGLAIWHRN